MRILLEKGPLTNLQKNEHNNQRGERNATARRQFSPEHKALRSLRMEEFLCFDCRKCYVIHFKLIWRVWSWNLSTGFASPHFVMLSISPQNLPLVLRKAHATAQANNCRQAEIVGGFGCNLCSLLKAFEVTISEKSLVYLDQSGRFQPRSS